MATSETLQRVLVYIKQASESTASPASFTQVVIFKFVLLVECSQIFRKDIETYGVARSFCKHSSTNSPQFNLKCQEMAPCPC